MTQKPTYEELEKKLKVLQESEKRYRRVLQTATVVKTRLRNCWR